MIRRFSELKETIRTLIYIARVYHLNQGTLTDHLQVLSIRLHGRLNVAYKRIEELENKIHTLTNIKNREPANGLRSWLNEEHSARKIPGTVKHHNPWEVHDKDYDIPMPVKPTDLVPRCPRCGSKDWITTVTTHDREHNQVNCGCGWYGEYQYLVRI